MVRNGIPSADGKHVGDLFIEVRVTPDPYFKREGNDIHVAVPISVTQAILGGMVDVLTVDGMIEMKIPAGTQPSSKLLLRDKGMPVVNTNGRRRGNQYVHIEVQIPMLRKITEKQKQCIIEFQNEEIRKAGGIVSEDDAAAGIDDSGMPAGANAAHCGVKRPFSIEEAWKRVKNFVGANDSSSDNDSSVSDKSAKEKKPSDSKDANGDGDGDAAAKKASSSA